MKGEILKKLRTEANMTQKVLANKLGIAQNTIAMIETNKRKGNEEVTHKVADFFNVSLDYLEGRSNEKKFQNEKSKMIDDFLDYLVDEKIITDINNIDDTTSEMILNEVKVQLALKLRKGKKD